MAVQVDNPITPIEPRPWHERDIPVRVIKTERKGRLYKTAYWCPVCGKAQRDTSKNAKHGCYCERCGQHLVW